MSVKSWKKEFYPISAYICGAKNRLSNIALIKHALRKWTGLTKANLRKHRITRDIIEDNLSISTVSCSLCRVYYRRNCDDCPLSVNSASYVRGNIGCESAWVEWSNSGRTTPMIKRLKVALKREEAKL